MDDDGVLSAHAALTTSGDAWVEAAGGESGDAQSSDDRPRSASRRPRRDPANYPVASRLGDYVRQARRLADLSQRDLAGRAGVSRGLVARIEGNPKTTPTLVTVELLLAAAGLELQVVESDSRRVVCPMAAVQQRAFDGRRFPAHLDVRAHRYWGDWWADRFVRAVNAPSPTHTFSPRPWRDMRRRRTGVGAQHCDERDVIAFEGRARQRAYDIVYAYAANLRSPDGMRWVPPRPGPGEPFIPPPRGPARASWDVFLLPTRPAPF